MSAIVTFFAVIGFCNVIFMFAFAAMIWYAGRDRRRPVSRQPWDGDVRVIGTVRR